MCPACLFEMSPKKKMLHPLEWLWLFSRLAEGVDCNVSRWCGMSAGWSCCAVGMVASCSPALSAWRPNKDGTSEERRRNSCPRASLFPALSKYLLRLCWASINNRKESPSRTWRHLSTDGRDVHFAATMPLGNEIGKTDSTQEKATCSAHLIAPLDSLFHC